DIIAEIDIETSAQVLEKRWKGGNPYEDDEESLAIEAMDAPIQLYGEVEQHLQINPPSIWRADTTLLDYVVLGFMIKIVEITPGTEGPRFVPVDWDSKGKVSKVEIQHAELKTGDLVRV